MSQTPPVFPGSESKVGTELSVGEKVTIRFAGIPTPPPPYEERIRENGTISPPFIKDPVQAAGLTPPQLQQALHEAYIPHIFTTVSVTVIPKIASLLSMVRSGHQEGMLTLEKPQLWKPSHRLEV